MNHAQFLKALSKAKAEAAGSGDHKMVGAGDGVTAAVYPSGRIILYGRPGGRLGEFPALSLSDARAMVRRAKAEAAARARAMPPSPDIPSFYRDWLENVFKGTGRNLSRYSNLRALGHYLAPLKGVAVSALTRPLIVKALVRPDVTPMNRFMAFRGLSQALDHAVMMEMIQVNPCRTFPRGAANPFKRPKSGGFPWVPAADLPDAFFKPLASQPDVYRALYLYIALTCCRLGESRRLQWRWVGPDSIDLPGAETKTGAPRSVPITPQIRAFLDWWRPRCPAGGYAFPGADGEPVAAGAAENPVAYASGHRMTLHGLRKSARTWMADNGVPDRAAEMLLGHVVGNSVERAYNYGAYMKEQAAALGKWDAYLAGILPAGFKEMLA